MEQKWAEQLDKINFFVYCWKLAHLIFLIFCIKLEGIKGYKLPQTPYLRKFLFSRFRPKSSWPIRSLDFSNCYIFWTVQSFFIIFCVKIDYYKTFEMMSLSWKNTCLPQKTAKSRKSGWSSWEKSIFCILLNMGSLDCFITSFI